MTYRSQIAYKDGIARYTANFWHLNKKIYAKNEEKSNLSKDRVSEIDTLPYYHQGAQKSAGR